MKWLKHDTDASSDAKIKKLIMRFGAEGYAVYFHCLELIAGDISENNITFELEHDAEIIADNLKIKGTPDRSSIDIVNDIMMYIVQLNLFSESGGRIFCFKLLKRLDSSMTSSTKFRSFITNAKESHDLVMIGSCKKRREEIRTDKIRIEENTTDRKESNREPTPVKKKSNLPKEVQETYDSIELKFKEFFLLKTGTPYTKDRRYYGEQLKTLSKQISSFPGYPSLIDTKLIDMYNMSTKSSFWNLNLYKFCDKFDEIIDNSKNKKHVDSSKIDLYSDNN